MRFKHFLESSSDNLYVVIEPLASWDSREPKEFEPTRVAKGQVIKKRDEDTARELVFFSMSYEDDWVSNNIYYCNLADWNKRVILKRDYDRNWLDSLKEERRVGDKIKVTKEFVADAMYSHVLTKLPVDSEIEILEFNEYVEFRFYDPRYKRDFICLMKADKLSQFVDHDELDKIKRAHAVRFMRGLKEDNFTLGRLKVGQKFVVAKSFSAKESELGHAHHFATGENIEYAGSKPWKQGKIIYFFGKKDEFNTHYMFEVPEQLFFRSVTAAKVVKEEGIYDLQVGQQRVVIGDGFVAVVNAQLVAIDSGTITITRIVNRPPGPTIYFMKDGVEYIAPDNFILQSTCTPEEKKRRDRAFLKGLKESANFNKGDKVVFTQDVKKWRIPADEVENPSIRPFMTAMLPYSEGETYFFVKDFGECVQLTSTPRKTNPGDGYLVKKDDFNKYAITPEEYKRHFLNGLIDRDDLNEEEKFKIGDDVWFKTWVTAIIKGSDDTLVRLDPDVELVFYGFEDGFANIGYRWRRKATLQVLEKVFRENAINKRERHLLFLKGLVDKDE